MTIPIIELALPSHDLETEIKNSFLNFPRRLPSWLFYDKVGSSLFVEITKQSEYYLTNAEFEILSLQSRVMLEYIEAPSLNIIELGAGDGHKSFQLIGEFLKSFPDLNYFPIDISMTSNQKLKSQWLSTFPGMSGAAITAEYMEGLTHLRKQSTGPWLVLFLGSNLGNYSLEEAKQLLKKTREHMKVGDYLLLGLDLKKDPKTLLAAYNDSAGFTAQFNLNILARLNREFGCNFVIENFHHYGTYNPSIGGMESFLISNCKQTVNLFDRLPVVLDAFEPIQTETSLKFMPSGIEAIAEQAGFNVLHHFSDKQNLFVDSLLQVKN